MLHRLVLHEPVSRPLCASHATDGVGDRDQSEQDPAPQTPLAGCSRRAGARLSEHTADLTTLDQQ